MLDSDTRAKMESLVQGPGSPVQEASADAAKDKLKALKKILDTLGRLGADLEEVLDSKGKEFASDQVKRAEHAMDEIERDLGYAKGAFDGARAALNSI